MTREIRIILSLIVSFVLTYFIDGGQDAFCKYLYYGSNEARILSNLTLLYVSAESFLYKDRLGNVTSLMIIGCLLTSNYLDSMTIRILHNSFSYAWIGMLLYRVNPKLMTIVMLSAIPMELLNISNYIQEIIITALAAIWIHLN